ncbi:MAG: dihydroorotate dehydrogenase electron transfer subunit [Candidatus Brocadiia bacterium]
MSPAVAKTRSGEPHSPVVDERATVVAVRQVARDIHEVALRSPRIAAAARPGQFVDVLLPSPDFAYRVLESGEADWSPAPRPVLLRRPFSVYRTNVAGRPGELDLLVKTVGEGTRQLVALSPGSEVKLLGPLGNGFRLPPPGAVAILVAGGCGWASLGLLARELRRREQPTYAFVGAEREEGLPFETSESRRPEPWLEGLPRACLTSAELESLGVPVALAAERGGRVYGGVVTDLLGRFLDARQGADIHVLACGPRPMLATVAALAREHDLPCQVALEERMACGIGVCNGCVVEVVLADGSLGTKRLCVDGPVLDAREVNWAGLGYPAPPAPS